MMKLFALLAALVLAALALVLAFEHREGGNPDNWPTGPFGEPY